MQDEVTTHATSVEQHWELPTGRQSSSSHG